MIGKNFRETSGTKEQQVTVHDIHSLRLFSGRNIPPVSVNSLSHLINSQAELHTSHYSGSPEALCGILQDKRNTLNGFAVLWGDVPAAYSIYYPMLNAERGRGLYVEDFFIGQSFRSHGLGRLVFHELARRAVDDNATYIQWSTDKRNQPVHDYVQGVHRANKTCILDVNADRLLRREGIPDNLRKDWTAANFTTRPIEANDGPFLSQFGIARSLFQNTGDFSIRGFLTLDKIEKVPLALTLGWWHFSTFKLEKGICLEHPVLRDGINDRKGVLLSVADCVRRSFGKTDYGHVLWHIDQKDEETLRLVCDELGFEAESMMGSPESEFVVYEINNGTLQALAQRDPMPQRRLSSSPASDPIGTQVVYIPNAKQVRDTSDFSALAHA